MNSRAYKKKLKEAFQLCESQDYDAALAAVDELLESSPRSAQPYTS